MALTGKIDIRQKAFPKEILALSGTFNHIAANLNQIAKKRNSGEELNALERADLKVQSGQMKALASEVKSYLQ